MPRLMSLLAALSMAACAPALAPERQAGSAPADYRVDNALWYDGAGFQARTAYVRGGTLSFASATDAALEVIDAQGGYVIPPLCEGHNHNLGDTSDREEVRQVIDAYLGRGVFYAMMHGSFPLYRDAIGDMINHPASIDVAFASNGLTGSGGHPRALREFLMERFGSYPEFTIETLPDNGYFEADTLDQVHEKWALIRAGEPDFVKVMLYFSEEYAARRDDPEYYGRRGLDPELLGEVVRLAHRDGLRVSVHVESEADMIAALEAGADMIAHLPSYDADVRLSDETVALAAESGAALITTLSLARRVEFSDPQLYAEILEAQRDNLRRLHAAGARLVLGSDNVRSVSDGEARHIAGLEVLANADILDMWTLDCAQTAFPGRRIGRLAEGYEASFLILEADPLADLGATGQIRAAMKQGQPLALPARAEPAGGE